jgi:hypothetical protein
MKRLIVVLLLGILLAGCGGSKVHKNISEDMAADTEKILSIFDSVIQEDRDFTEREYEVFSSYVSYYESKLDNPDVKVGGLTEEENKLFILTSELLENPDIYTILESDKERYQSMKKTIQNVIKDGKI